MIEFLNVSKTFISSDGSLVEALRGVSLSVFPGEFVSLVGASGCGKSTLLRLINGLIPPTSGELRLDGQRVLSPRPDCAMVFQAATLLPWANIENNVLFPLTLQRRLTREDRDFAAQLLTKAGLDSFEKKMPRELSGGMQQRVAICRGLVQKPRVLLMDEPFGALDALTREQMSLELLKLWEEFKIAVLFVTHSIPEAVLLSDRVVVMSPRPGRVVDVVDIDLERPRQFSQTTTPEFQSITNRIRTLILGEKAAYAD
ncbi:ABC transporter ATP-binding protein [Aureimonas altamirensis]|uniref:ABC transporter ATP-binding protein n=1 Tax=Aureimonas altamirensis TaxID=370622 RepID=UPI001E60BF50|nr:ABC transporter ATP-binding protein [Aureimonas altamirensis]UHD46433.1 ABC transporter ATP-binding protein [Aureimonas altamirensis]